MHLAGSWIKTHGTAELAELAEAGPRPRGAWCCALAAGRSARRIAASLRCHARRAFDRESSCQARLPQTIVSPAPRRLTKNPGRHLKHFASAVAARAAILWPWRYLRVTKSRLPSSKTTTTPLIKPAMLVTFSQTIHCASRQSTSEHRQQLDAESSSGGDRLVGLSRLRCNSPYGSP